MKRPRLSRGRRGGGEARRKPDETARVNWIDGDIRGVERLGQCARGKRQASGDPQQILAAGNRGGVIGNRRQGGKRNGGAIGIFRLRKGLVGEINGLIDQGIADVPGQGFRGIHFRIEPSAISCQDLLQPLRLGKIHQDSQRRTERVDGGAVLLAHGEISQGANQMALGAILVLEPRVETVQKNNGDGWRRGSGYRLAVRERVGREERLVVQCAGSGTGAIQAKFASPYAG